MIIVPAPLPSDFETVGGDEALQGRAFTISPLVVIGTREGEGYDLAPKHMATFLGWSGHFGFVCTRRHATYRNASHTGEFTVSFPRPTQVVLAGLAAAPRAGWEGDKPLLDALPTYRASVVDGVFLADAYLCLECRLVRTVDGFGDNSLLTGRIVTAHVHRVALRTAETDDEELLREAPLLAYLDPGRFATVRESRAFPFPAGFRK